MSVASLRFVIDHSPLPDVYRRHIWTNISFLFTSEQSYGFFALVEVTGNGLCPIFHRTVLRSCENLPMFVWKTLLTSYSGWTLASDHVRRLHHLRYIR